MDNLLLKIGVLSIASLASVQGYYDPNGGNRGQFVAVYNDTATAAPLSDTDKKIYNQIQSVISSDKMFSNVRIASFKDGKVVLSGSVDTPAAKTKAESLIGGLKGVNKVENNIDVNK